MIAFKQDSCTLIKEVKEDRLETQTTDRHEKVIAKWIQILWKGRIAKFQDWPTVDIVELFINT